MSELVLYRKYRPRAFEEVVGQEHVITTIGNAIRHGKVAHAYLFAGPRGTGKTTIARLLAKTLNCQNRKANQAEPCGTCVHCKLTAEGRMLDLIEIDAASNRGIDEIRALREGVRVGASQGEYKIYLVDEVHMLTKEAFNAFLKTLEEPPPNVVFVLATTEVHKLPATIISRTQRFDFHRINLPDIEARLLRLASAEKISVDGAAVKLVAIHADGSLRDAESLFGQVLTTGSKDVTLEDAERVLGLFSHIRIKEFVEHLLSKDSAAALSWIQAAVDEGRDLRQFLKALQRYVRRMMLLSLDPEVAEHIKEELNPEDLATLKQQTARTSEIEVRRWMETFAEAQQDLDSYPLQQMAIEIAIVELLESKSTGT